MAWDIIDYDHKYFDEMLSMTAEYYGADNDISDEAFVRHQYFHNPFGDAYIKFAHNGSVPELAGQYIVIPRGYSVMGQDVKAVLSLNTLTREAYRGQGVFTGLAEAVYRAAAADGVAFCYGAPNQNSYPGFLGKLSFSDMGELPLYLKIANPLSLTADKLGLAKGLAPSGDGAVTVTYRGKSMPRDGIFAVNASNASSLSAFWKRIRRKYPVMGNRDADFLRWRFLEFPKRTYTFYGYAQGGRVIGYAIGREMEVAGMRCGMVVDLLFERGRFDAGAALLKALQGKFKEQKIGLFGSLMQPHTEEAALLRKNGYFICPHKLLPQPFPIICRRFTELEGDAGEVLSDFQNWFFTMGDYDVI